MIEFVSTVLSYCEFENYDMYVREIDGSIYLQAEYVDNDVYTGYPAVQSTRKWLIPPDATRSSIVQTAFKMCLTSYEHRVREGFKYKGQRVFGPHFDVEDLVELCRSGRDNAGGGD
jgi:hypothetical protein